MAIGEKTKAKALKLQAKVLAASGSGNRRSGAVSAAKLQDLMDRKPEVRSLLAAGSLDALAAYAAEARAESKQQQAKAQAQAVAAATTTAAFQPTVVSSDVVSLAGLLGGAGSATRKRGSGGGSIGGVNDSEERLALRAARFLAESEEAQLAAAPQACPTLPPAKKARKAKRVPWNDPSARRAREARAGAGAGAAEETEEDDLEGVGSFAKTARPLVGTCQALEKPFFRLTSAPDPRKVRPVAVLQQALTHIKNQWVTRGDYAWTSEQLRSLRQDLVVQHVRSRFTCHVYETHARIALESGDLDEYNRCVPKVTELAGAGGGPTGDEFCAYRLLNAAYARNATEVCAIVSMLSAAQRSGRATSHAIAVLSAVNLQNYDRFFCLYQEAPNMSAYLMDFLVARMRRAAWARIIKAYSPTLALSFVQTKLGFESNEEVREFVDAMGGVLKPPTPEQQRPLIDTHASRNRSG